MNSSELYDAFRSDVADVARPYLWSDEEVWRYMDDAYRTFVRLTGGIADSTSDLTQIPVVTGEADAEVSPLILRFREARLNSTGRKVDIINQSDMPMVGGRDYGSIRTLYLNKTPGPVQSMVIGNQRGLATWVQVPMEDDTVSLSVYRLPLTVITGPDQEFTDVQYEHHEYLLAWMKARAYGKQDADTFDKGRRDSYVAEFRGYCAQAKAEWERLKHKPRSVVYGGI